MTKGSSNGVSQLGFVGGCEEDLEKVVAWPVMAWINWTEAEKMTS